VADLPSRLMPGQRTVLDTPAGVTVPVGEGCLAGQLVRMSTATAVAACGSSLRPPRTLVNELPRDDTWGAIRALQAETGEIRWEFKLHSAPWAGVMSTAGSLVFAGSDEGNFFALNAQTGKPLWEFQTGGSITANPISFTIDGHQYIAIAADRVLYTFGL
jgi:glucose dehydrogenase